MSTTTASHAELLAAQLGVLRDTRLVLTPVSDVASFDYQIAYVRAPSGESMQRVVQRIHALRRLAQLARTDEREWAEQVQRLWPHAMAHSLIGNRRRAVRFDGADVVGYALNATGGDALDALCTALRASVPDAATTEAQAATAPEIPLHLNLLFMEDTSDALEVVADLAFNPERLPRIFCVKSVGTNTQIVREAHCLCQLTELAELGVAISNFPRFELSVTKRNAAQLVGNLQLLFSSHHSRKRLTRGWRSIVQNVRLSPALRLVDDRMLLMLISAIGDSPSVREFTAFFYHLNEVADSDAYVAVAQTYAYALFSRESRHKIQHLTLESGVHHPLALQRLREVLEANDPVAAMCSQHAASVAQHANERLSASEFVLFDPEVVNNDVVGYSTELKDHAHQNLRIICESPEWWSVMLPAWGRAWVRKADATLQKVEPDEVASSKRHLIPEFSVHTSTTEEMTQSLSWLAHVGSGANQVSLRGCIRDTRAVKLDWTDAKTAFPNAQTLNIRDVTVNSLCALADGFSSGLCSLRTLTLYDVSTDDPTTGLGAFLELLCDADHAMTKALKVLVVAATQPDQPQAEIVAAALRMLSTNRQLHSFELRVKRSSDQALGDFAEMRAAFAAEHRKAIRVNVREKLALLSVASQYNGGALQNLDSRVFADVFRFAGLCTRLTVRLVVEGP